MPPDRQLARNCSGPVLFPSGCTAWNPDPLARCTAATRAGQKCQLCQRAGRLRGPVEINDIGWNIVGSRSVQIIRTTRGYPAWLVVVMASGRLVDPRWPIIACGDKATGIDLAFARVRQLVPRRKIVPVPGDDAWKCGNLLIWVAE